MDTRTRDRKNLGVAQPGLVRKLDSLKRDFDEKSRTGVIKRLVDEYQASEDVRDQLRKLQEDVKALVDKSNSKEGLPIATSKIMEGDRPALITGSSGAGKTRTIKALLDGWAGPVFALDVKANDYGDFERVDLGKVSGYAWASAADSQRLRFAATSEISSQAECEAVLQLIALAMRQESSPLKRWVVILEEGQRFTKNAPFKEILSEGRVFCRKLLIGSQLSRPFRELVPIYAPMKFDITV